MLEYLPTYSPDLNPIELNGHKQKKREWLRYRDFVLSQYGVIKIKSLGYNSHCVARSAIPARYATMAAYGYLDFHDVKLLSQQQRWTSLRDALQSRPVNFFSPFLSREHHDAREPAHRTV
ncbi:hypothetical protein [Symbiopectobacterium sp. RP]|uniref:hypothetical protein n=1 Tax=Symbiopectobacterium sp. RP TaxID=3248553 RepID=UPI003D284127